MEKGKALAPFFQFSNTQCCPFLRSLVSLGLAVWPVSIFFDRRHLRRLRTSGSQFSVTGMLGQVAASVRLLGFAVWDACCPVDAGEGACASERVLRDSWREAGERLERESCARMYHLLYLDSANAYFSHCIELQHNRKS